MKSFGRFPIDVSLANEATECRLNMDRRAAEPVVEVEMTEGGVEIVPIQKTNNPAAKPHAFRIGGGAAEEPFSFGKFVDGPLVLAAFAGLLALLTRFGI